MKRIPETDHIVFNQFPWILHQVDMKYKNGKVFPRIYLDWPNSVMIFALTENDEFVFIKEFCRAMNHTEIFAPKGKIDANETAEIAAQRELQEETGVKAQKFTKLGSVTCYPNHLRCKTTIFLAQKLQESTLSCAENEEIEVIKIPLAEMDEWMTQGKITESRVIAGWHLVQNFLKK